MGVQNFGFALLDREANESTRVVAHPVKNPYAAINRAHNGHVITDCNELYLGRLLQSCKQKFSQAKTKQEGPQFAALAGAGRTGNSVNEIFLVENKQGGGRGICKVC